MRICEPWQGGLTCCVRGGGKQIKGGQCGGRKSATKKPAQWPVSLYSSCIEQQLEVCRGAQGGLACSIFYKACGPFKSLGIHAGIHERPC